MSIVRRLLHRLLNPLILKTVNEEQARRDAEYRLLIEAHAKRMFERFENREPLRVNPDYPSMQSSASENLNSPGARTRYIRGDKSRKKFAASLKIGLATLQRYENDERQLSAKFIINLYKLYKIDPLWLLTGKGPMTNNPAAQEKQLQEYIDNPDAWKKKRTSVTQGCARNDAGQDSTTSIANAMPSSSASDSVE